MRIDKIRASVQGCPPRATEYLHNDHPELKDLDMDLMPATYYIPGKEITVCYGFTPIPSPLAEEIRFRVVIDRKSYRSEKIGLEGLVDLKDKLENEGFVLPSEFGKVKNLKLRNIRITDHSVILSIKEGFGIKKTRLTFQYRGTYGSFNRAVKNALTAQRTFAQMQDLIYKQESSITQSLDVLKYISGASENLVDILEEIQN